jgi:hypothetical protein
MITPNSPYALDCLRETIAGFDSGTRQRGSAYYKKNAVIELDLDDDIVTASVQGSKVYTTTLAWNDDEWSCDCSCPIESDCKHAFATALAWIDTCEGKAFHPVPIAQSIASSETTSDKNRKLTFRQQWTPILAEKIGRALTEEEGSMLGQLSALFSELRNKGGSLSEYAVHRHGFAATTEPPGTHFGRPAYEDWWSYNQPPADPWALWQFIAYDWERHGREIPAAFRAMTDTGKVRIALDFRLTERDLNRWRQALGTQAIFPVHTTTDDGLGENPELRLAFDSSGVATLETRLKSDKPWRPPARKWLDALAACGPEAIQRLPENARALALTLRLKAGYGFSHYATNALPPAILEAVLANPATHPAIVLPDGSTFRIEDVPLVLAALPDPAAPTQLALSLILPDQTTVGADVHPFCLRPTPLYLIRNRIWRGPPPLPAKRLPIAALGDPSLSHSLRAIGLRVPDSIQAKFKHVPLRPLLHCWIDEETQMISTATFHVQLFAKSDDPPCAQYWSGQGGWLWTADGEPPATTKDGPQFQFDLTSATATGASFRPFRLGWSSLSNSWTRSINKSFPEDFADWRASLPPDAQLEVSPELQGLVSPPLSAKVTVSLQPSEGSGQDWFDLSVELQPSDLTLTPEEIQLLVKARGRWVRLPTRGWQRLALEDNSTDATRAELDRLGLAADADVLAGKRAIHRFHTLQLAGSRVTDYEDALAVRLRARAAELRAITPPAIPDGLQAVLRPYQEEGYHFLAHLSSLGLGGVLADDMGLGKTLEALTWLLWLQGRSTAEKRTFRVLVVCPKSVVPNWQIEAARFSPSLSTARLGPDKTRLPDTSLLVINYAQLRLRIAELQTVSWEAVILDEGQNIKNPSSATAQAARDLSARHRLVLTGTPIENRLLDLWSLFAFAQPGLLGSQAGFQRLYSEKTDPAGARSRLATRVRSFLLRRTKGQVARDLPPRIEEDIFCELEGPQRALYEAELKRARQMLLKVKTAKQFDTERFNILQSLLRLRQICCDPRLIGGGSNPSSTTTAKKNSKHLVTVDDEPSTSAKLDALLDTLEPLVAEGHRVLVFSQFVTMLELIKAELVKREIDHLLLTGQTENRQDLVNKFQSAEGPPIFLLSLKAAGSGLNLTAASYVVLYDPWWNPAVEAQAIDRTHRIGQASQVIAYRLLAKDTIEEKIRALQHEKAAMAAAVVKEESLATVLDLESLRKILL